MGDEQKITRWMADASGVRRVTVEWQNGASLLVSGPTQEAIETAVTEILERSAIVGRLFAENKAQLARHTEQIAQLTRERDAARVRADRAEERAPARPAQLLGPGVVRIAADGKLWLLNGRERGWSRFGFPCGDWDELFRRFNVRITEAGSDEWGPYWVAVPIGEART